MLIRSFIIPCLSLPGNYKLATLVLLARLLVMIPLSLCCKERFTLEAADFHLCKWPTFMVTLAIKEKTLQLWLDAESIKHKSLTLLYELFSFRGSEIRLIFMHSDYRGGPAELCLWICGVWASCRKCWQHKHTTSCSAAWCPLALSHLQQRWCLSLDAGESV